MINGGYVTLFTLWLYLVRRGWLCLSGKVLWIGSCTVNIWIIVSLRPCLDRSHLFYLRYTLFDLSTPQGFYCWLQTTHSVHWTKKITLWLFMCCRAPTNYSGLFIDDIDHTQPVTVEVQHTQYQSAPPQQQQVPHQVPVQQVPHQVPVQQVPFHQQRAVRSHTASTGSEYNNRELTSPVTTVTTTEETYRYVWS